MDATRTVTLSEVSKKLPEVRRHYLLSIREPGAHGILSEIVELVTVEAERPRAEVCRTAVHYKGNDIASERASWKLPNPLVAIYQSQNKTSRIPLPVVGGRLGIATGCTEVAATRFELVTKGL